MDPNQKYFITYESYCKLKHVSNARTNTERVKYTNTSKKYYRSIDNKGKLSNYKKKDNNKCLVDLSLKPINIIMEYGGYDLFNLKNDFNKKYKKYKEYKEYKAKTKLINPLKLNQYVHFIKTYEMFKLHFKSCFKNLAIGLYKLHKVRIVNRDIKTENIVANFNNYTNKIDVRYIDFGLSEYLTPHYCNDYYNIKLSGSYQVIAPEIFITFIIHDYHYHSKYVETGRTNTDNYSNNDIIYLKKMISEIKHYINNNVYETLKSFKQYEYINNMYKISDKVIYTLPIIDKVYNDIKTNFDNKTILNAYFGTKNIKPLDGYLQKSDVYSLGCAIYEFITHNKNAIDIQNNIKLNNLLKKMVNPDPEKRYNILQCLKHPYFK